MKTVCGEVHPERLGVCDKLMPCSGYHADSCANVVWGYTPPPEPAPKPRRQRGAPRKAELSQIAQRAE